GTRQLDRKLSGDEGEHGERATRRDHQPETRGNGSAVEDAHRNGRQPRKPAAAPVGHGDSAISGSGYVGDALRTGLSVSEQRGQPGTPQYGEQSGATAGQRGGAPWDDAEWIPGADGKARR